jgi:hypothetical protein
VRQSPLPAPWTVDVEATSFMSERREQDERNERRREHMAFLIGS